MNQNNRLMDLSVGAQIGLVDDLSAGYKRFKVVESAIKLGVFDYLAEHGSTPRESLVQALDINGMYGKIYFQVLVDCGLLTQVEDAYDLTDAARQLLVRGAPCYQGDMLSNLGGRESYWNDVAKTIGQQRFTDDFNAGPSHELLKSLASRSMRGELQGVLHNILSWKGFGEARKVLDVGGGHGLYSIALCQTKEDLRAEILDKPHVVDYTKSVAEQYGMADRIHVRACDATVADWGSGNDIVLISHVLYKFRKQLPDIFQKARQALNIGGILVSNHWFCAPGCTSEQQDSLKDLEKSMQSFGHPLCHIEDFQQMFADNGFELIIDTKVPSQFDYACLHIAKRVR